MKKIIILLLLITGASAMQAQYSTAPASLRSPHEKDFYTGIYLNPLGFLQAGPIVGAEFTFKRRFILDVHLRFPSAGLLTGVLSEDDFDATNIQGISGGASFKYFTGGRRGGFYVGPFLDFQSLSYDVDGSFWEGTTLNAGANLGYKFQFSSGFYMRTGIYLGVSSDLTSYWNGSEWPLETSAFGMAEVSLGFAF
jgi:hypothetical protein